MMSGVMKEKYAAYFATMNPLCARIYSDIQHVQQTGKIPENTSFSERCALLDKHLIHDRIKRKQQDKNDLHHQASSRSPSLNESENEEYQKVYEDHLNALMLSVYPKKPERYIYDENEKRWIDEHSEPFSFCTPSQVDFCALGEFVKKLPISPHQISEIEKERAIRKEKKIQSYQDDLLKAEKEWNMAISKEDSKKEQEAKKKCCIKSFGVPLIQIPKNIRIPLPLRKRSHKSENEKEKPAIALATSEDRIVNLNINKNIIPNGNQSTASFSNIIETKAKIEEQKTIYLDSEPDEDDEDDDDDDDSEEDEVDSNLPNQKQNLELIAELQAKLKLNKNRNTSNIVIPSHKKDPAPQPPVLKVLKPKAPPPPPPRKSNSKENVIVVSENGGKPKQPKPTTGSSAPRTKGSKDEDFTVDVSSPCKIATPKTGFDFLDNW